MRAIASSRPVRRVLANPSSLLGAALVLALVVCAIAVILDDRIASRQVITNLLHDPYAAELREKLRPPGSGYVLGTDALGRDVLSRMIYASQTSFLVGFSAVALAVPIGVAIGMVAAYYGRTVDEILMRAMDVLLTLPTLLLALALVGILGRGLNNIIFAIALVNIPVFARIARGSALKVRQLDFVQAAQSIGEDDIGIIMREILPNSVTPVIIQASFSIALAIIFEATISFLGLGVSPPSTSWG